MKRRIYLDTSVVSVHSDPRDPFLQNETIRFWKTLDQYEVYISRLVEDEVNQAAAERKEPMLALIRGLHVLPLTQEATRLANIYVDESIFTRRDFNDALHVALATTNALGCVVSWNFRHLVKLKTRELVSLVNARHGYGKIEIVAPPEL